MKCDELKVRTVYVDWKGGNICYYDPNEVDAAIAELKRENRKLKRALWLSRALALSRFDADEYLRKYTHCNSRFWNNGFNTFNEACKQMQKAINIAEAKCRAKAEGYK